VTLAADLLDQAFHLASFGKTKPKQASLRRAISTAYYSMFHLILDDAARYLVSNGNVTLRGAVLRTFEHNSVKKSADAISRIHRSPNEKHWLATHLNGAISTDLALVCGTLVDLKDQRDSADYDVLASFTRSNVTSTLSIVHHAETVWGRTRHTYNARVFLLTCAGLLRAPR
jgi:uncharacterized protein (UPF0332 family)